MPVVSLKDAISSSSSASSPTERIVWIEPFTGQSQTSEFCEASDPTGHFESNSSTGHKDYQDRLRAIALRSEGKGKAEIASLLGRSANFVQTWWRKNPKEVFRPPGVHEYLHTEYWRDLEIVRGFGRGLGVYEQALRAHEWIDQMADGPSFKDGGSRLKYDKEGRMRPNGSQYSREGHIPGRVPSLDALTQRLLTEQGIDDRVLKRPGMLWYPDGGSMAIPHRHECWTALLSFGAPRILTIDGNPVLLRDGDLIVFGTQRHGVPKMYSEGGTLDNYGGRMSVVFFFMPTGKQAIGAEPWKAIVDEADGPSRKLVAMQRDADLGAAAERRAFQSGPMASKLEQLVGLGFSVEETSAALRVAGFDLEQAVELLLGGGVSSLGFELGSQSQVLGLADSALSGGTMDKGRKAHAAALYGRLAELQREVHAPALAATSNFGCIGDDCSLGSSEARKQPCVGADDDEALALRLQMEETGAATSPYAVEGEGDSEELAILQQLQELEEPAGASDPAALCAQFACYEQMLNAEDAETWDGRGDLMARHWRREHLHIEQQRPVAVYAFGCGLQKERAFYELLSLLSIRVLYDFRSDSRVASSGHFAPSSLETSCKARSIVYKHVPLGRESAYGILKHLREDEGRNTLAELVWHAQRKRSAFLGAEEEWRNDQRLAIAVMLREAGHRVMHVATDCSLEEHPLDSHIPEHIAGEEARLRAVEKRRAAGEDAQGQKSAVSCSTEAVAQQLSRPREVIDAGAELRKATTQRELCNIQRRLADLQRKSEEQDAQAGLGPNLLHVNKWIKAEAAQQRANLAAGKTKDGKENVKGTDSGMTLPDTASAARSMADGTDGGSSSASSGLPFPAAGEGYCGTAVAEVVSAAASEMPEIGSKDEEPLLVECLKCHIAFPWSALMEFDGLCAACVFDFSLSSAPAAEATVLAASQATLASAPLPSTAAAPPLPQKSAWRAGRRMQRLATESG